MRAEIMIVMDQTHQNIKRKNNCQMLVRLSFLLWLFLFFFYFFRASLDCSCKSIWHGGFRSCTWDGQHVFKKKNLKFCMPWDGAILVFGYMKWSRKGGEDWRILSFCTRGIDGWGVEHRYLVVDICAFFPFFRYDRYCFCQWTVLMVGRCSLVSIITLVLTLLFVCVLFLYIYREGGLEV